MPAPGDYSMQLRIPYLRLYSFMSMHERLFIPVFFKRSCDLTQKLFTERNARHKPCMYSSVSYSLFKWRIHHTPEGTCVLRCMRIRSRPVLRPIRQTAQLAARCRKPLITDLCFYTYTFSFCVLLHPLQDPVKAPRVFLQDTAGIIIQSFHMHTSQFS